MNLDEIKNAVAAGKTVHWKNDGYVVYRVGEYNDYDWIIVFIYNQYTIGLTWKDGVTMNGEPEDFYIGDSNV